MKGCAVPECSRPHVALGLCRLHYQRHQRSGTLDARPRHTTLEARLAAYTRRDESGCLLWTAGTDDQGYGKVRINNVLWRAHVLGWVLAGNEKPPRGFVVDHACHTPACPTPGRRDVHRRCLEPTHLRVLTIGENVRRVP